jgi:hypothetical protein
LESGLSEGEDCICLNISFYAHVIFDLFNMIYVYVLLAVLFSVDPGLTMLANPTHIRSKGVMHKIHKFEGEVWKFHYHILMTLLPCSRW